MKLSRLINLLQEAMNDVGDVDVVIPAGLQSEDDEFEISVSGIAVGDKDESVIICDRETMESFR